MIAAWTSRGEKGGNGSNWICPLFSVGRRVGGSVRGHAHASHSPPSEQDETDGCGVGIPADSWGRLTRWTPPSIVTTTCAGRPSNEAGIQRDLRLPPPFCIPLRSPRGQALSFDGGCLPCSCRSMRLTGRTRARPTTTRKPKRRPEDHPKGMETEVAVATAAGIPSVAAAVPAAGW